MARVPPSTLALDPRYPPPATALPHPLLSRAWRHRPIRRSSRPSPWIDPPSRRHGTPASSGPDALAPLPCERHRLEARNLSLAPSPGCGRRRLSRSCATAPRSRTSAPHQTPGACGSPRTSAAAAPLRATAPGPPRMPTPRCDARGGGREKHTQDLVATTGLPRVRNARRYGTHREQCQPVTARHRWERCQSVTARHRCGTRGTDWSTRPTRAIRASSVAWRRLAQGRGSPAPSRRLFPRLDLSLLLLDVLLCL